MSNESFIDYLNTPAGILKLVTSQTDVQEVIFTEKIEESSESTPNVMLELKRQLSDYFEGKSQKFDLPIGAMGTNFQQKVWQELMNIPYGKTISYLDLAKILGDEKVIRAAASANGKNPIAIIIPCHRVIGQSGKLVGYAGGLNRKKWLLEHESKTFYGNWELF